MQMDLARLNVALFPLLLGLVCLSLLDLTSTLVAMRLPDFHELNPVAAALFGMNPQGFALALVIKYLPFAPIGYLVFLKMDNRMETRILKLAVFIALVGANVFYAAVVANNIPQLIIASG